MSVVEEIKERLDIVEVISAYVPLRKAGNLYKGLCPFHQEKTPSFVVYPDRGAWHCFGACGVGGDVFSFVMKRDNLDFREALEVLAQKAGVDLAPPSAARSQQDQYLDRLREINQAAALFFHSQLRHAPQGQVARDYLAGRGFSDAVIDAFLLGYAADRWDGLLAHLQSKNYQPADILAAGLVIEREQPEAGRSPYYDRFRHRVMVPIRDVHGHVVGFGARSLRSDQQPKYLNTPQTPLFDKSSILYGLDAAKRSIRPRGKAIIVEGYMDVLACHQAGEDNVVASMGTALTEPQIKQLRRYTSTIVLALDADAAGQAATLRGLSQTREALVREVMSVPVSNLADLGAMREAAERESMAASPTRNFVRFETRLAVDLRVMTLPEGKDPDDVVRADVNLWRELVNNAQPVVDYYFGLARRELDLNSAQGKSEAVERLGPLISEVGDVVKRDYYFHRLAQMIQTDEHTLRRLLDKQYRQSREASQPKSPELPRSVSGSAETVTYPDEFGVASQRPNTSKKPTKIDTASGSASHCLALLVQHPELLPDLQAELVTLGAGPLDEDDFSQADERAVCAALVAGEYDGERWPGMGSAEAALLAQLQATAQRLPPLARDALLEDMLRAVLRLRIDNLKTQARTLPALTRSARDEGQVDDVRSYQQIQQSLSEHLRLLQQMLSQRTHTGRRQMATSL